MKNKSFLFLLCLLLWPGLVLGAEETVNISYVKSPFNLQHMVMKKRGLLERELEPLGVKVIWHEINSGAQQARAMASSSLDIGGVMNTTSIQLANGEGNPIRIVAAVGRPTDLFAIVGSRGINSLKDLKGKTVAGPKGTVLHQLLLAALAMDGMTIEDVNFVQMDIPKAFAALQSGSADAALLAANMLLKAEEAGNPVLARATGLVAPKLAVAASEKFIKNYPERLAALIRAHDKAAAWIAANPEEALAIGAAEQGISLDEARRLFAGSHFTQRFDKEDLESMETDQDFMLQNGMMRNRVNPRDMILPGAME